MNVAEFKDTHSVFRLEDYAKVRGKVSNLDAVRNQLKYYVRLGRIKRVGPGVYANVPFGYDAKTYQPDPVLVAVCVRPDAIFSHHTALELLGVGHSLWHTCTLFCEKPPVPIRFNRTQIQFLGHPGAMVNARKIELGIEKAERKGYRIRLTGRERTLVDGFRQLRWVGGPEELVTSASGFVSFDLPLLESVLNIYDQRNLWASVGWFLEQFQKQFYVPGEFLKKLASRRPEKPRYLARSDRGGTLNKRWNLIIPDNLLHWEGQRAGTEL